MQRLIVQHYNSATLNSETKTIATATSKIWKRGTLTLSNATSISAISKSCSIKKYNITQGKFNTVQHQKV